MMKPEYILVKLRVLLQACGQRCCSLPNVALVVPLSALEYFPLCLRIPILCHPVATIEIHSYLQNSNSTFLLTYAHDYRQRMTSPSIYIYLFIYIYIYTQHTHTHTHTNYI